MTRSAWNRGKKWPESIKRKISESKKGSVAWNKGKPWSKEVIDKISISKKGQIPWNKGISWPESTKKKISESKKGSVTWNKGKPWSQEVINKISASKKGKAPWNKGRSWPSITRIKISRTKLSKTIDLKPFFERNWPSKKLRFLVLQRDNFKCVACGKTAQHTILEVGHKIPVSKGGKTILENLITLCLDCNRGMADLELNLS